MKMTRKILPALAMLLVSAIMLSTASFAWFAENNSVEASGMNVKVQSTASFLQINNQATDHPTDNTKKFSDSAVAANSATATLDLVHATIGTGGTISWYTAKGETPGASTIKDGTQQTVTIASDATTSPYARIDRFYVRMSEGSASAMEDLTVKEIRVDDVQNSLKGALRVLVVGANGAQIWEYTDSGMARVSGDNGQDVILETVPTYTQTASEIVVYTYFDGEDTSAFTDNTEKIDTTLSVTISFSKNTP